MASSPFAEGMVLFNVSVGGGGSTASVLANDSFTVSFDYFCQVVAGFTTLSPQRCIFRNRVDCTGENGTLTFRLKAPAFPSQYLIGFDLLRTLTEPPCPTSWPNGPPVPDRYIACVSVTAGDLPYPVTGHADNVTGSSATLHGQVNPSGFPTTCRFVYGTAPGIYTDSVAAFESPVNGSTLLPVSGGISGLSPNTRYYYRATAENVNGYNVAVEKSVFTGPQFALAEPAHSFGYIPLNGSRTDSITVLNTGNVTLPITSVIPLSGQFLVDPTSGSVPPLDSMKFAVTYDPPFYGRWNSGIVFLHGAVGSPDTLLVSGAVPIGGVLAGWNIISVPLNVVDPGRQAIFPEAVSSAFGFTTMYYTADTLVNGKGYWLKFPATDSMTVSGEQRAVDNTPLSAGWNIVGVPSFPVPMDSVSTVPPGIIMGNFFEYASGYASVSTLRPGKGYWVRVSQGGTLRLSGELAAVQPGTAAGLSPAEPSREDYLQLTVTDAVGESRRLYVAGTSSPEIELPPAPPPGDFDARFEGNLMAARPRPGSGSRPGLEIRDAVYPLTIAWSSVMDGPGLNAGGRSVSLSMPGEVLVGEGERVWLTAADDFAGSRVAAGDYGLFRNYPNPFNPSTVISFTLRSGGSVELSVYNPLGERVAPQVDRFMGAGRHEVEFNASALPAGVYIARLNAEGRTSSIKMLLVK
ncbi:MAG TPA: T9SS type A sorting domain-containing protein [Bacteroidota bacterium]|nr:T9SS type A sorting domain-containing protein [Bacteroidota bacterium]